MTFLLGIMNIAFGLGTVGMMVCMGTMSCACIAPEMLPQAWLDWVYPWSPARFVVEGARQVVFLGAGALNSSSHFRCLISLSVQDRAGVSCLFLKKLGVVRTRQGVHCGSYLSKQGGIRMDQSNGSLSRRSFLQIGGVSALGLGLMLTGCGTGNGGSSKQEASQSSSSASSESLNYDEISYELIQKAAEVLSGVVISTPLKQVNLPLDNGPQVYLKMENLQHTGVFKLRGAYFKMSTLTDEQKKLGVVTCSAGNHAQGVGYASREFGIPATIFIPSIAPQSKIDRTRKYGVDIQIIDGNFEAAKQAAEEFAEKTGAIYVPPYNDACIMAGQGTIGLEIMNACSDLDAIVVPVGGGGLIGGIAVAAKTINPDIKIYGVESEGAPCMHDSLAAGKPTTVQTEESLADGLDIACPGDQTFAVAQKYVDEVFVINEEQISNAMKTLAIEEKIMAEGAGACAYAATSLGLLPLDSSAKVACVVSGGNVDTSTISQIITS